MPKVQYLRFKVLEFVLPSFSYNYKKISVRGGGRAEAEKIFKLRIHVQIIKSY